MTKDDLVGETEYYLDDVFKLGKIDYPIKIAYKGKEAGAVV